MDASRLILILVTSLLVLATTLVAAAWLAGWIDISLPAESRDVMLRYCAEAANQAKRDTLNAVRNFLGQHSQSNDTRGVLTQLTLLVNTSLNSIPAPTLAVPATNVSSAIAQHKKTATVNIQSQPRQYKPQQNQQTQNSYQSVTSPMAGMPTTPSDDMVPMDGMDDVFIDTSLTPRVIDM